MLKLASRGSKSIKGETFSPTWEVSAASGRAAPHPAALVDGHRPAVPLLALQRVGRQVAHLQLCEVPLEILERHPGRESDHKWLPVVKHLIFLDVLGRPTRTRWTPQSVSLGFPDLRWKWSTIPSNWTGKLDQL